MEAADGERELQIPGIAVVGPQFKVAIQGSVAIVDKLDFTYGFDLKVCCIYILSLYFTIS
jgi:hypothetical protein